ncbi:MAG TPA: site-2 protease family protein [Ignavibacteriaceae bacterium]|nr:site-2 protease family protein [Ignavibacteriaceae bacterium]
MENIQISERLISFLMFIPIFLISLTVHELAHAFSAYKKGDSTAKNEGRLTLNPIKHLDIVGSVLMPLASFASGFLLIGWAKPVPVNRNNFKNPLKDDAFVSFAGPFSNLALAVIFAILLSIFVNYQPAATGILVNILWYGVFFNVFLFAFNLLPIPPLDGSHILFDLFPNQLTAKYLNIGFYGTIILFLFIYSPLWKYFFAMINFIISLVLSAAGVKID